ncbi:hypothetical protein [Streptomyces marincola]|uniref:hypothetical protein n=1 Tax=Streptomyces marincola TaxID=2878388 RepID=UPI001CF3A01D|nr:hypothetical protein [Streptomyces marincola]UCM89301.1 hypothetical protein LC193_15845 [Streptomyces marincola]
MTSLGMVAPVFFVLALVGLVAHAVRRLREGGGPRLASPRPWALVSVLSLSTALLVWGYAELTYATSFFPEDVCHAAIGERVRPEHHSDLPLSTVCGGVEMVPGWVNPVLFGLAGLSAVAAAAVPLSFRARRAPGARARLA